MNAMRIILCDTVFAMYALIFAGRLGANRFLRAPTLYVCSGQELVGASNYFLMSRSDRVNLFWVSSLIFQQTARMVIIKLDPCQSQFLISVKTLLPPLECMLKICMAEYFLI